MRAPLSTAAGPPFEYMLRVYWEDTDAGGVVFYANYLKFFERARTEWLRALGIGQQQLREATGALFVVVDATVRFLAPARLDDCLNIGVQVVEANRASLLIAQQAACNGRRLAEGRIRIGCVDASTFRARRLPADL